MNLALIGHAVSEKISGNNSHVHVHSPGAGADNPLWSNILGNVTRYYTFVPSSEGGST